VSKIRKGDDVVITTGKDKGKRGIVLSCLNNGRLVVEGINRVKKHTKPNPMKGLTGGIVEKEMSINASNVALFNPSTQKADRVGYMLTGEGRKVRMFKSNKAVVEA
jgi:large subunit ribosomal protein L24